ncbi:dihydrofolate reductase [Geobacter pelophilus]|uniref:Dihydrofolate reductase n=1 Tax=Geoanaerobacter pelophilus TaxID=60036 RepID=A0AAW4LA31_9BACT|nr:dihydrofolate reductase [Geoanaerobacter pelophilus]MBT0665425.1 dihydrofolate reductase [Geoanaerobacter pelophilus]
MISIIAAVARNRIIGWHGGIPWDIPADRHRFRELTMGHTLIMGRKTFESIGRPLPGRRCVVISRNPDYAAPGCQVVGSVAEALALGNESEELFIAGGAEIYSEVLPFAQRLYLTVIDIEVEGDTRFPEIPEGAFCEVRREPLAVAPAATLVVYERQPATFRKD